MMLQLYCTLGLAILMVILARGRDFRKIYFRRSISELERLDIQLRSDAFALNSYIAVNKDFRIVFANSRTKKMMGWNESDLVGKKLDVIFPDVETVCKFIKDHPEQEDETLLRTQAVTKLDKKLEVEIISGLWANEIGSYYTIVMRDVTHRVNNEKVYRKLQEEINTYREIYSKGEKIGRVGFWYLNDLTGKLKPTPGSQELLGANTDEVDVADVVSRVVPADKVRVSDVMRDAKDKGIGYRMTYKINGWDGYINTIESVAEPVYEDGMRVGLIGMARLVSKETT